MIARQVLDVFALAASIEQTASGRQLVAMSSSKYPRILETRSLLGADGQSDTPSLGSFKPIFFENLHTITPTPPSFLRVLISRAFLSSQTLRPSLMCSLSTFLFLSTRAPATPVPHTISPDFLSYLQHSGGSILFETSVEIFGRLRSDRCSRMVTSDQ